MIFLPTTAGTGSEASPFAVIKDDSVSSKRGIENLEFLPKLVILDPEFLETLDIPYELDSRLSGSIGFNEGVYFEIRSQDNPNIVLVRGGRHNELFALLGGDKKIGSVGIEIYVDALVYIVGQMQKESLIEKKKPDIFVASIGPEGQKSALKILSLIQKHGLGVKESFGIKSLKQQLLKAKKSDGYLPSYDEIDLLEEVGLF
jgi:histidyl-tRNA synthetase